MFIGRKKELAILDRLYQKDKFEMAVVYGRRRIGKTWLLEEFLKDKNHILFPAKEVNDR
jgi:AAA+ ATPase superfamily predicted ATPase